MNANRDSVREDHKDFLWKMYNENRNHLRHYQSQRATASNIILVSSIGVIGFVARKPLVPGDWPLTCGLIVIGLYGTVFIANHFECINRCKKKADDYLARLNALMGIEERATTKASAVVRKETLVKCEDENDQGLPRLDALRTVGKFRVLWPLTITVIGIIATAYIFIYLR